MELYILFSIVDRHREKTMLSLHQSMGISVMWSYLGEGTATSDHLRLYDLEESEKSVICGIVTPSSMRQLILEAKRKLYIDIPGNGVMFAVPVKSVAGRGTIDSMITGQTLGGGVPDMNFDHELIIVIMNEGHSDEVMDAARQAGAGGGTVFHAKGTVNEQTKRFLGVSMAQEKDVVYIISPASRKSEIMGEIVRQCGTNTQAGAVCCSVPVSEVAGLRKLDEE